ncbi:serine/threonine-protein kinase BRSK1 [Platysternon megacephalum]|uniref:Serine/threonine-protein kinase BRSK1 n=1 Tax=Platysternon megacephalum TaxID=55544 RepID=A0A4D9DRY7_9SAUR|nr:serine/threonine-protein kinase BRSK1 [Platysternon megacephalum]
MIQTAVSSPWTPEKETCPRSTRQRGSSSSHPNSPMGFLAATLVRGCLSHPAPVCGETGALGCIVPELAFGFEDPSYLPILLTLRGQTNAPLLMPEIKQALLVSVPNLLPRMLSGIPLQSQTSNPIPTQYTHFNLPRCLTAVPGPPHPGQNGALCKALSGSWVHVSTHPGSISFSENYGH